LRQNEARMRGIVETAVDGILTINEQGGIESFNLAAERIFNCRAADVIGNPVTLLMASPDRELYETSLRMGGRHMMDASREVVGKRRDGETFPLELTAGETPIGGQRFFTVIVRDISERKRVADQLQQAERLALVGQLASGLVHEIGTPLNIISGSGELLLMDLQAQQLPTETAEAIIRQTERITGLMQQLLTLSRPEQPAMRPFSLHAPLDEALHLLDAAFHRDRIKVTRDIPNELPSLWGIADQIEQVFLNVLVNAWQAMPYGGEITIAARQTDDGVIHLTFHDTGVGMESAEVERAFEPFYTSKGSQGTGLGLMVCKQIVEAHQGRMALESVSGVGTTVHLHLSCVSGAP
jgi:PAS domain S-box-containing protein